MGAFFGNGFWCLQVYFAFGGTFCYCAQFGGGHVGASGEGVVAFAALPNANASAFNFDESAAGASVGGFESSDDFDVSFANGGTVAGS